MFDLVAYGALRACIALFALLPFGLALAIGRALGGLAFSVLRFRRAVVMANLRHTIGAGRSEADLVAIARKVYRNFGMTFVEIMRWSSPRRWFLDEASFELEDREKLLALRAEGKPLIVPTAHNGNFDIGAAGFIAQGLPTGVVMKPAKSERFTRFLVAARERNGLRMMLTEGGLFDRLEAHLRAGGWLGILPDQNARQRGVSVDFLGKPASFFRGPARLHLATGAGMATAMVFRDDANPRRHRIRVHFLDLPPRTGDEEADVRAATQAIADSFAEAVRADPTQYFWFHRLWGKAALEAAEKQQTGNRELGIPNSK